MSEALFVVGGLSFADEAAFGRWQEEELDGTALGMTPDGDPLDLDGEVTAMTPEELVADACDAGLFLDVVERGRGIEVEGMLTDDFAAEWCAALGAMWRSAARCGATGDLAVAEASGPDGGRLTVARGECTLARAPGHELLDHKHTARLIARAEGMLAVP